MDIAEDLLSAGAQSVAVARNSAGEITRVIAEAADGMRVTVSCPQGLPDKLWRDKVWMMMDPTGFRRRAG